LKNFVLNLFLGFVIFLSTHTTYSQELIKVGEVKNEIRVGPFANNPHMAYGVKNILEDLLFDYGYDLSPNADIQINVNLVFFDIKNIGKNIGFYHNKVSQTEIIAQGELYIKGKRKGKTTATGTSKEISTSTLVVASDGTFNQQTASNALKKVLVQIVEELLK
jgi:hypothetical protein